MSWLREHQTTEETIFSLHFRISILHISLPLVIASTYLKVTSASLVMADRCPLSSLSLPTVHITITACIILILLFLRPWRGSSDRKTACSLPLLGSLGPFRFTSEHVLHTVTSLAKLGPVVDVFNGTWRITILSDVNDVREVLYRRPKTFRRVARAIESTGLQHGIFVSEGARWSTHRRVVAPPFSKLNIARLLPMIIQETDAFVTRLRDITGEVVEFTRLANEFTISVIGRVAFDIEPNDCHLSYFQSAEFRSDMMDMLTFASTNALATLPPTLARCFSAYRSAELKAIDASQRLKQCTMELIEMTNESDVNEVVKDQDRSDSFIRAVSRAEKEGKLSFEEVVSDIVTLFVAGTDTTAIGISWTLFYLSSRPDIQNDIRREVQGVEKVSSTGAWHTSLELCRACFKEALRKQGPVAFLPMRTVEQREVLLSSGRVISPYDTLWLSLDAVKNDSQVFEQPELYDPYRWLTSDANKLEMMQKHFLTFGGGPRICPGMDLALSEGTFCVAKIVSNFTFQLCCPPEEVRRMHRGTASISKMPLRFHPL